MRRKGNERGVWDDQEFTGRFCTSLNIYAALFYCSNIVKVRTLLKKIVALKKATIITTTFF